MIQRIQSIFLLIVAGAMSTFLFTTIAVVKAGDKDVVLKAFNMTASHTGETQSSIGIGIAGILCVIIALFSISQFKNRLNQMKLGALNSLLMFMTLAISYFYITEAKALLGTVPSKTELAGFAFPIIGLMFNLLSNRFIKRDDRMVRDADRLR